MRAEVDFLMTGGGNAIITVHSRRFKFFGKIVSRRYRGSGTVWRDAARELRNYANTLVRGGSATSRYISKILALASKLDGNQPDSRFTRVEGSFTARQPS